MEQQVIEFTVLGDPIAQKRHRSVRMGNHIRQYDPSASDKGDFLSLAHKNAPEKPIDGPILLELYFFFPRPKSHYRTGSNSHLLKDNVPHYHTGRPDVDNNCKAIMDSLSGIFWKDDSKICVLSAKKLYSEKPRTEIKITVL